MAHILIIDDDMEVCIVLTSLTERAGHEGAYALTLKEGLQKVFSGGYDIVFLDIVWDGGRARPN